MALHLPIYSDLFLLYYILYTQKHIFTPLLHYWMPTIVHDINLYTVCWWGFNTIDCDGPMAALYSVVNGHNDQMLLDTLTEVYNRPLLLMGDFNYPDIDWSTSTGGSATSQRFVDGVEDGFLTQHVMDGTCNGAKFLDLVISSEPEMTDSVLVLDKFGSSDHNLLQWEVKLSPIVSSFNYSRLDYTRADFDGIREALRGMDWQSILWGDANNKWSTFLSILKELESRFVPLRKSHKRRHKVLWMTYNAIKLVYHKHKLYKKYKSARHPAYAKAAREATREVRQAKRNFEKLSENIDTDRKSFYAYVQS